MTTTQLIYSISIGTFLICLIAIGAIIWFSVHNKGNKYQDYECHNAEDEPIWDDNETTGY